MAEPLQYFDADTGEAVTSDSTPTGRDQEYSCGIYYLTWGRWPIEHPSGFVAMTTGGAPAELPKVLVSLDLPVRSTRSGRLLEGQARQEALGDREQDYERYVTSERRKLAESARPRTPRRTPSPTGAGGKDRSHVYRNSVVRRVKKRNARFVESKDAYISKTFESAREYALDRTSNGLRYLTDLGYHGVEDLNEATNVSEYTSTQAATNAAQDDCQDLPDFKRPRPFDELINRVHFMSVQDARRAIEYEIGYNFLQRPRDLRLQLRQIQQDLREVRPFKISSDGKTPEQQRMEMLALVREGFDDIRSTYDQLLVFADKIADTISSMKEEKAIIPKELLMKWETSDEEGMKKMMAELFKEGLTKKDERFLDRTHYTQHFTNVRALINLVPGREFCQKMEHFGQGLQEMRDAMDFAPRMTDE
jgi:hypothetical protein